MTLRDQTLRDVVDQLAICSKLENVSLVGNTKLGVVGRRDRALAYFVRKVGRKCKVRNRLLLLRFEWCRSHFTLEAQPGWDSRFEVF